MTIDCDRCEMRGIGCRDCVIAVIETRNVTYLPNAELRALRVLADAGLVPPLRLTIAGTRTRPGARTWTSGVIPDIKAS
jgi:hypothetical protein